MSKRFFLTLLACILILMGIFWLVQDKAGAPDDGREQAVASSHTYGEGAAEVTLIEYGDFQCPGCQAYFPVLKQIKEQYKDQIVFQFRHFPLAQIHPNAMAAHRAAEAAGMQDKFWEMHDMLFERASAWNTVSNPTSIFESYAEELELDVDLFKEDFASSRVNSVIQADIESGKQFSVNSTPTFILNGEKLDGTRADIEYFTNLIDDVIAESGSAGSDNE